MAAHKHTFTYSPGYDAGECPCGQMRYHRYTFRRATHDDLKLCVPWREQFAEQGALGFILLDYRKPTDWHMMPTESEAIATLRYMNAPDDDGGAASEALWQARMAGEME
jgi:hypothetical protein